jgi:predicted enzyme related to lactoylglutathione lyase
MHKPLTIHVMAPRFRTSTPVLPISDYARARAFYCEGLGFGVVQESREAPAFGILRREGAELFLDGFRGRVRGDGGNSGWDAYLRLDDVHALAEELRARGIAIATGPTDTPHGMREMEVVDPDGNRIGFGQELAIQLHVARHDYVLAVHDLDRTRDWFVRVLKCTADEVDPGSWIFCRSEGFTFMIGRCPDALPPSQLGDHAYFAYLFVNDVDAWAAHVANEGAEILAPPSTKPWGVRELALRTVDGHRIMLGERVTRAHAPKPAGGPT